MLKKQLLSNKLSALDIAELARSARQGGNNEPNVKSMARAGNWGKAPKNLARDLLRAVMKNVNMPPLFWWPIYTWDKTTQTKKLENYPFLLPHEMFIHITSSTPLAKLQVQRAEFPELHARIVDACENLGLDPINMIALGMHGDGVPFTKTDTMEMLSWNFLALPTADRIPITSVSKKFVCQCGCKGQCTWMSIFKVIKWSLLMLFAGTVSQYLPDGTLWSATQRASDFLKPLAKIKCRCLLLQVRGDWPFLRTLFQFPSWRSSVICWLCRASRHGDSVPFTDCGLSALWRQLRYRPNQFLASLIQQGFEINPLLSLPGFTIACVVLDWLHVVDLGVGADVMGCFFWELITVAGLLQGVSRSQRLLDLWTRLRDYYKREKPPCVLDNLTETMIKKDAKGSKPKLRAKGAECRYLYHFAMELSATFANRDVHWGTIHELFKQLYELQTLISKVPYAAAAASDACRKFCVLYTTLGQEAIGNNKPLLWQAKPKLHLLQEMVEYMSPEHGSPRHFWCYRDESWCGFWARASKRKGGANTVDTTAERFLMRYMAFSEDAF